MVYNPYDNETSSDDPRKAKLRDQAQQQFIAQLQQRIAAQSNKIEELDAEIQKLHSVINQRDQQLSAYSQKVEEERLFFEQDKKARSDREYELSKQIQQLELELQNKSTAAVSQPPVPSIKTEIETPHKAITSDEINNYIEKLMAFYKKPTNDAFIETIRDLISYGSKSGTTDQQILGTLLKSDLPLTEEKIVQKLNIDEQEIHRALFRLSQKEVIKKIGKGFVLVSSDYAEMTDITKDWSILPPEKIYENLMSVVYVGGDKEDLEEAFTRARDALMELGALSTMKTHAMSQIIERIKRQNIDTKELIEKVQEWRAEVRE